MIKSESELRAFFDETLVADVKKANAAWQENRKNAGVLLLVAVGIYIIYRLFGQSMATWLNVCLWILLILLAVIGVATYIFRYEESRKIFVSTIAPKVIEWLPETSPDSRLKLFPEKIVDEGDYFAANVYPGGCYVNGKYLIEGVISKVRIRLGEVHGQTRFRNGVREDRNDFCGLVLKMSFHKNHQYHHYIIDSRRAKKGINCVKNNVIKVKNPQVVSTLENNDFNRSYTVFSENDTELRYLLSPALMEQLVNVRKKMNCIVNISLPGCFKDSSIHILMDGYTDILGAEKLKNIDFDSILTLYRKIVPVLHLVHYLNLDTRIWSKSF